MACMSIHLLYKTLQFTFNENLFMFYFNSKTGTNFILSPKIYSDTLLFNVYKNKIVYYYLQKNHIETCF